MNKSKKNVGFCRAKIVTKYYITVRELPKGDSLSHSESVISFYNTLEALIGTTGAEY